MVPIVAIDDAPFPKGGVAQWLTRPDGARLRVVSWGPDLAKAPCRGTIVLASGRTEFVEKYFEVIELLLERGFAVATFDWRGQGLSERMLDDPRKGHVDDFSTFDADFVAFMDEIVKPVFPKPYIGIGHSMGGNLMFRAAHNLPTDFAAIVLSAPMLGINLGSPLMAKLTRGVVKLYAFLGLSGSYVPGAGPAAADVQPFDGNSVTSDEERYQRQQAVIGKAPSIGLGGPTVGWVLAGLRSIAELSAPDYIKRISVPVLAFDAGADKLVDGQVVREIVAQLPRGTCVSIPGSEHEILMEQEEYRFAFWSAFDQFIEQVLAGEPDITLSDL